MHSYVEDEGDKAKTVMVILDSGNTKNIPDFIANIWIKTNDVVVVDDGSKDVEIERLKAENEKLKAMAQGNQDNVSEKEALIKKCKEYGLRYGNPQTVSVETLKKKIEEYESKSDEGNAKESN